MAASASVGWALAIVRGVEEWVPATEAHAAGTVDSWWRVGGAPWRPD